MALAQIERETTIAMTMRWAEHGSVRARVEAVDDGTRLRVVESGFDRLDTSAEEAERNHADNTSGWTEMLRRAADYAERVAT